MAKTYTIPEILRIASVRGYTPRLSEAVSILLNSNNEIEYQVALREATEETTGLTTTTEAFSKESHFSGLPIYMPLVLEGFDNVDDYLLDSAIVSITRQRKIVLTELQGRDTSVKEFINNGDYEIGVKGLICNNQIGYPKDRVKEFERFMTAKQSIKVVHEALNNLGIYEMVITDYSLPSTPFVNAQSYSFNAVSEKPIELTVE